MQTIDVRTGRPYQVLIGKGLLEKAGDLVRPLVKGTRTVIVCMVLVPSYESGFSILPQCQQRHERR